MSQVENMVIKGFLNGIEGLVDVGDYVFFQYDCGNYFQLY